MSDATQAILPVTPEDVDFANEIVDSFRNMLSAAYIAPATDQHWLAKKLAARRQTHSLPGDVGMREALETVNAILEAAPELNPSNYDHDQVCELNTAMVEACLHSRAALTPSAPEPVQKVHELPEGHRWCRHCEQNDPHCSVCEGVGYLPSALSGDAGEVQDWQKPYADAGHDIASVFNPMTTKCKRCGTPQIDLSEDLAYGPMRQCRALPSHQGAGE